MANSTAIANSWKVDLFGGVHSLANAETIKAALFLTTGSIGATTATYAATNEVSGSGYSAGGVTVTHATAPTNTGATTYWTPSAAISYGTVTLATAFDCVLLYYSGDSHAIASWNFGSTTVSGGTFTINMPTNDSSNALMRIS
jgi:hypothetical protein